MDGATELLPEIGEEGVPHARFLDHDVIGGPCPLELPAPIAAGLDNRPAAAIDREGTTVRLCSSPKWCKRKSQRLVRVSARCPSFGPRAAARSATGVHHKSRTIPSGLSRHREEQDSVGIVIQMRKGRFRGEFPQGSPRAPSRETKPRPCAWYAQVPMAAGRLHPLRRRIDSLLTVSPRSARRSSHPGSLK
jgi:hypothetical protein